MMHQPMYLSNPISDSLERQGRVEKVQGGFGEYRKAEPPTEDRNE
jgi:hypothetical protein